MFLRTGMFWVKAAASFFGIGYCPVWSGAAGSLAGLALAWWLPNLTAGMLVVFSAVGFLVCRPSQTAFNRSDPPQFVMDEVCGMMLSVIFLPTGAEIYIAGYVLFRIFDVWKPWPIALIQRSRKPSSIMWDDLAAGLVSNLVLQIATRVL